MSAWLRYLFDRCMARFEPHCPFDWSDCHSDCRRCKRIWRRGERLARYAAARTLPSARML